MAETTGRESLTAAASVDSDREVIYLHINAERDRQDAKWGGVPGEQRRDDHTYAAVLGEEFGECCKAWLERDTQALREELVQTAAVAVAWIEELDRGGAKPRMEIRWCGQCGADMPHTKDASGDWWCVNG